ncbi:hypothetical protein D3C80_2132510 [compost metagenome]
MACAANNGLLGIAQTIDRVLYRCHTGAVERRGGAHPVALDTHVQAALCGDGL